MRRILALFAVLGCGGSAGQNAPKPLSIEASTASFQSDVPQAPYGVVPAELADDGIGERLRHRVVLRRWTTAFLRRDDADTKIQTHAEPYDSVDILPVIDEVPRFLRVVIENDKARYAVWVPRADAASTVLASTRLDAPAATVTEHTGVWLEPGVVLSAQSSTQATRRVRVVDDELAIEGDAPATRVGNVWIVPPGGSLASDMKRDDSSRDDWEVPIDRGPLVALAAGTVVRGRPGLDGAQLAKLGETEHVGARKAPSRDGWTEIEVFRPHVRVRGFVPDASVLGPGETSGYGTIGLGNIGTSSHAIRHKVDEGACLYDRADGEVIGVELASKERLGGQIVDGWAMIYVQTPWGVAHMYVKNVASDRASPPVWDTCTH